ncbi:phosphate acyltransferase PlsX [Furfurilactobacillus siliginis]|uniref:Phosphate acyltransferase n=1 Tax=Furfurilactobacillus siliginis TaxID=348151 RepID=A0A0R2LB88_9LACO|nr:phosphate acyltransferase PlsX [Furfurilactobacillus siliginis]KRN96902.1 glycerol-3-phosphate acyltransferase PlsX [Furfurilactobacillus siliginis]GEK28098.1 phosphate acyltransferase [Furfurilactobacillus siliginis]
MKIAVDAMGGDNAPEEIVKGIELARDAYPDMEFQLYGPKERIQALVTNEERIEIVHAASVIAMEDEPVRAVRSKKDSSIVLAATAVKEGRADAFFSAGNTGAVLAAGLFIIGRIKGIDRPGLTTTLPVVTGDATGSFTMLDVGANADYKLTNLEQFAVLGNFYGQTVMGIEKPKVGLLNNGTEADKGDKVHRAAFEQLSSMENINFIGNVESRELLNGAADVVVTDGFTGNATLKAIEGTALSMLSLIRSKIMASTKAKMGYVLSRNAFHEVGQVMDYSKHGGAVLLGLKGAVVKTHGSAKAETVRNTMGQIHQIVASGLIAKTVAYFEDAKATTTDAEK